MADESKLPTSEINFTTSATPDGSKLPSATQLVIDVREKALIAELVDLEVSHVVEPLDVGDILIRADEIFYIIERKTIADLIASIVDGRYREQKNRILDNFRPDQVMYIIEGHEFESADPRVTGALLHMLIRDRIQVYHVQHVKETAKFLMGLINDWDKYRDASRVEYQVKGNISTKKKDNVTTERCFVTMLTCITGVSLKVAKVIAEKYPNFTALVQSKNEDLYALKVNQRKISKTIVSKLIELIGRK